MRGKIIIVVLLSFFIAGIVWSCKDNKEKNAGKNTTEIEQLETGNRRFLEGKSIHPHQDKKTVLANQNGQKPFAVIITCSDSRVSPEIIFDQGIGDLFVIRNAGNLISDIDMGSIEYAIEHLDTKLIIVLGHTECGAVKAYINDKDRSYKKHLNHIDDIVETISNEDEEIQADKILPKAQNYLGAIKANIKHSTKQIQDDAIAKGHKVKVVSMCYDVHTGKTEKI